MRVGVDPLEGRGARPGQRHARGVFPPEPLHSLHDPRRDVVQRRLVGEFEAGTLDEVVPPEDVDVLGSTLVGRPGDGAGCVFYSPHVRRDAEDLSGLEIGPEADEQLR